MKQWEMSEVFTFPTYLGNVIDASSVQVVPNWQQEEKEDSIVIKGVYVIKGHVQFDFVPREDEQEQTGIYIEHLDVEKDQAYFEYALPFSIDVPNEEVEKVTIRAINPQFDTKAQNHCTCSWNVCCDVEKRKAIVEEQLIKPTQPIQPKRPIAK